MIKLCGTSIYAEKQAWDHQPLEFGRLLFSANLKFKKCVVVFDAFGE